MKLHLKSGTPSPVLSSKKEFNNSSELCISVSYLEDHCSDNGDQLSYSKSNCYKILLIDGPVTVHCAAESISISGTTLLFFDPKTKYTIEHLPNVQTGFVCVFPAEFFPAGIRHKLTALPVFSQNGKSAYSLNAEYAALMHDIFNRLHAEINSSYLFKFDLLRNYIAELMLISLKLKPDENLFLTPGKN